ncbi:MAG: class I SAM-dependent methyltransferase [Eubacteriales bacterium]|nr:class I SAM-dependent methyltransferase [Eubacteriales bacterium]
MKNYVVESYENYREEDRLTTNNARKIEFLTTVRVLDDLFDKSLNILDCAAGTGVYAFYLADKGHQVTATDITPRHIEIIKDTLKSKNYKMDAAVLNAVDMNIFADEIFDVVLNMGPFYHLLTEKERMKCLSETLRVVKRGGLIVTTYIPRYYVFQLAALTDKKYLDERLSRQLIETGVLRQEDEKCFWTDTYYSTKEEMERIYRENGIEMIDHFAQDGLTPMFADKVDQWNEEEFRIWCDFHYGICREASILGTSNHVMIIGRKM